MPRKYVKKSMKRKPVRKYKRTYKKRQVPQRNSVSLGMGFPKIVKMTHRYCETVRIVSTGGVPGYYQFRANSMNDPNQTGTGHQPLFYDQMTALYNHWKVIGSKITVQFIPSASTTAPQHIGILNDDDTLTSADINTLSEQIDTRKSSIAFQNARPTTLTQYFSARKVYGPSIMGNNRLEGDASANPTEQFYFTVYNAPVDGTTSVGLDAIVTIDYIAVWTEQKDVSGS